MTVDAPMHHPTHTHPAGTSRLAIASLVLGILSTLSWILGILWILSWISLGSGGGFVVGWIVVLGPIWPILALIVGNRAKDRIGRAEGTVRGRGLAIAGIVLGSIGAGVLLLSLVLAVVIGFIWAGQGQGPLFPR